MAVVYRPGKEPERIKARLRTLFTKLDDTYPDTYVWNQFRVKYILSNEKYIGDSLWQKAYTPDVLPLHKKVNHGVVPKYYCEGTQEPIVSKELFAKVQALRKDRKQKYFRESDYPKLVFDGKIRCRHCGWRFKPKMRGYGRCWICTRKGMENDTCPSKVYSEKEIRSAFLSIYNTLKQNEKLVLDETISALQVLKSKVNSGNDAVSEIDEKLAGLASKNATYANLFSRGVINELVYYEKADQIKNEMTELRSKRLKLIKVSYFQ